MVKTLVRIAAYSQLRWIALVGMITIYYSQVLLFVDKLMEPLKALSKFFFKHRRVMDHYVEMRWTRLSILPVWSGFRVVGKAKKLQKLQKLSKE